MSNLHTKIITVTETTCNLIRDLLSGEISIFQRTCDLEGGYIVNLNEVTEDQYATIMEWLLDDDELGYVDYELSRTMDLLYIHE